MRKYSASLAAVAFFLCLRAMPALAIPMFSQEYGVSCDKCHSVMPHLNAFGAAFLANGYRIPGVQPGPSLPISVKANLLDSSESQGGGPNGAGLPKAIVDEVELFTTGAIGSRSTFFVEQYAVDGGMPGLTRDAWVIDQVNPWGSRIPIQVQAGSFTLPLPVDPETFRETFADYAVYVQTVGSNSFNFFDPKIGVRAQFGDPLHGLNLQTFAGPGHDRQNGLPSTGTDSMFSLQDNIGPLALTAFRYSGTRPSGDGGLNAFERTGYGIVWDQWGRFSIENMLINGNDTDCGVGIGIACQSSGGFTQIRYAITRRIFALGRYEGTNDPVNGFHRDAVLLLGAGPTEHSRITIEDVIAHTPQTTNTMNVQLTVAR